MSLKKKVLNYLNENKSAQGSLIAVVAASVILSVIVASATQWYLAFNKSLNVSSDSLTGMSIAKDIWDKMTTQDFEDMKGKAGTTDTSDVGGYTVTREYGQAGVFDESTGECKVGSGSPTTDNPRACMDVTMKVTDKDGKQVFTATPTRVSQNLGNFYVKNDNFPKEFKVKMEDKDESVEMPEGKALYAYVDGQKVPLSSQGSGITIIQGLAPSGTLIPLPDGYEENECVWFVSVAEMHDYCTPDDIGSFSAYVDSTRHIRIKMEGNEDTNPSSINTVANYIVIGIHGANIQKENYTTYNYLGE